VRADYDMASEPERVEDLGGRPSPYRDYFPDLVRSLARLGVPLTEARLATFFKVSIRTIQRWKTQKAEFCASIEGARSVPK
jgi:hypothetical protein